MHQGYFDKSDGSEENQSVLKVVRKFKPNILIVGMGIPCQELWILNNYDLIGANVILNVGSTIEYFTGNQPTPPRIAEKLGLEWLFRLIRNPCRLWRRYLFEPWFIFRIFFMGLICKLQIFKRKL